VLIHSDDQSRPGTEKSLRDSMERSGRCWLALTTAARMRERERDAANYPRRRYIPDAAR